MNSPREVKSSSKMGDRRSQMGRSRYSISPIRSSSRLGLLAAAVMALSGAAQAQTTVFSENFGTPSTTTTLANYIIGTAPATFQNKGTLTYGQGEVASPADVRISNASSGYAGSSGGGNVFFTSTSGSYGFSIESINASASSSLQLAFAYRKESASVLPSLAVDYWNGTAWINLANTAASLFNEATTAPIGWYPAKTLSLPAGAQIAGLKIRFVKSGTASTRLDDVKLTGITSSPTVSSAVASLSGFFTVSSSGSESQSLFVSGFNLTADLNVGVSAGFEVSTDNTAFSTGVALTPVAGSVASVPIYVRIANGGTPGAITGTLTLGSAGAPNQTVSLSGTVNTTVTLPFGLQNFEANSSPFYSYSAAGNKNWSYVTNSTLGLGTNNLVTNRVMEMNGFGSDVAANDWLILGPIDCAGANNPVISFNSLNRYTPPTTELQLKVSTTYPGTGNPNNSSWILLTNWVAPSVVMTKTPSGQVSLEGASNQAAVYVAFHYTGAGTANGTTALWQIDDVEVKNAQKPALTLFLPASINEGVGGLSGTVSIPMALANDLTVSIASSDGAALTVDGGGGSAATTTATIGAGNTSASFFLDAATDNNPDGDQTVTLTASVLDDSYEAGTATIIVKNVDLPRTDLAAGGYSQTFSSFTSVTPSLPPGWTLIGPVTSFPADTNQVTWGTGTSGGLRGGGNVLGYQHTSSTGTLVKVLTLRNATDSAITAITINYKGRVSRITETRDPSYSVSVNGQPYPSLTYTTLEADLTAKSAAVTDLNIAPGGLIEIRWSSTNQTTATAGSSRQIGISDVNVTLGANLASPNLGVLALNQATLSQTAATISASVVSDGGSSVTERGLVYAATSQNADPAIGGANVTKLADAINDIGAFTNNLTGLTANTAYGVKAYAINSVGTNYSSLLSFITLKANPSFTGVYTQNFAGFSNMAALPDGWRSLTSSNVNNYVGDWSSASSSGGFYGSTNTNASGVLGYLHTGSTGILTNRLTLVNGTGSALTNLYVSYKGQSTLNDNTRFPAWTVKVNDVAVAELAYTTENGVDEVKNAEVTGLSIADGASFTVTWESDRGTGAGSSRRIGLTDVRVGTTAPGPTAPSNLSYSPSTINGFVGQAISSLTPTVTGTVDTYSVSPSLPAGLSINPTSGVISGTPLVTASSTYTVTAANAGGSTPTGVTIQVSKGTPIIVVPPTAPALTVGASLSSSTLAGGSASVPGTFAWTDGTIVPNATGSYGVTFTPTDAANYNTATTTVSVTLVHFLESALGDFSGAAGSPTTLNLGTASKSLLGSVTGGSDSADYLTFTVPAGYRLDALWLRSYQSTDNVAFMAIDEGATWSAAQDTSAMLGFSHFGGSGDVGTDLLTKMNVAGGSLAAGTYTVWIQQLGAATIYGLEFELTALPTGSTFAGWSSGGTLNAINLTKYAIGGASSLTASDGVTPNLALGGSDLVLTAIVRTDDPKLTVEAEAVANLTDYATPSSVTTLAGLDAADQTNVPAGCTRRIFSVAQGPGTKKFLRLKATLAP